ncbi:nucleoside triphosphate pyrophosphohydrolase [Pseudoteredinibacter isoporae]|uniref:Nucleoside triphosphate pyrophosphohydrolase n=1 Tax=Pseudoteredinibacter isoporae TaxID=570281 RepID=A0A7X0JYE2_9GAMM|nr:nucleoside triphosphate pyrophosphohydrolase [Pseudoteredinibacter isoporae]MBB6523721.1 ATP diphosphatase [Pseudoteredinibacter isoporae]NHO89224.1 nucleoside triphosphate pyrophosphohydrolase [Pseudoteredinibacter isoporae]NIB22165.1 nucleoside triphosphate pyrophosphohydrolase [Pseudoteredinibacter isoporae]
MSEEQGIDQLLAIMAQLRNPEGGCPWDLEQNFASIVPSTLEEAYEVADAIESNDMSQLKEELGDLLFQVVFYSQLGKEEKLFDFNDVASAISKKLIHRHPHVFSDKDLHDEEAINSNWEALKAQERAAKGLSSVLADIPVALPALSRAQKLQRRAANVGFDWQSAQAVLDKLDEEHAEFSEAMAANDQEAMADELGDMMFCLVNLSRHLKLDAESVLRNANRKFERRFNNVESQVASSGEGWSAHSPEQLEEYWRNAKVNTDID